MDQGLVELLGGILGGVGNAAMQQQAQALQQQQIQQQMAFQAEQARLDRESRSTLQRQADDAALSRQKEEQSGRLSIVQTEIAARKEEQERGFFQDWIKLLGGSSLEMQREQFRSELDLKTKPELARRTAEATLGPEMTRARKIGGIQADLDVDRQTRLGGIQADQDVARQSRLNDIQLKLEEQRATLQQTLSERFADANVSMAFKEALAKGTAESVSRVIGMAFPNEAMQQLLMQVAVSRAGGTVDPTTGAVDASGIDENELRTQVQKLQGSNLGMVRKIIAGNLKHFGAESLQPAIEAAFDAVTLPEDGEGDGDTGKAETAGTGKKLEVARRESAKPPNLSTMIEGDVPTERQGAVVDALADARTNADIADSSGKLNDAGRSVLKALNSDFAEWAWDSVRKKFVQLPDLTEIGEKYGSQPTKKFGLMTSPQRMWRAVADNPGRLDDIFKQAGMSDQPRTRDNILKAFKKLWGR
jgi:hypothetical protein